MKRLGKKDRGDQYPYKAGAPYALSDGEECVLLVEVAETPEIDFEMESSNRRMSGGFSLKLMGHVKAAEVCSVLQGSSCSIELTGASDDLQEQNEKKGLLGYVRMEESGSRSQHLQTHLEVKRQLTSDLVRLITVAKPIDKSVLVVSMRLRNESRSDEWPKGYPSNNGHRMITYEVVRFSCSYFATTDLPCR